MEKNGGGPNHFDMYQSSPRDAGAPGTLDKALPLAPVLVHGLTLKTWL